MPDDTSEQTLRRAILRLTADRGPNKTICPSEVARHVAGNDPDAWRPLMPQIKVVGSRLAGEGHVALKQGGQTIDPAAVRGAYRIAIIN
ncbi:DUF3253 domain-containing protein [Roseobacter sp. CCS2]|uniref:DUF3253 domain-containing protein n=1 Tax=Roseobacter sp. CCS2 TaxID=391593 RepID=UPI0000F3C4FB|nr:DUF3253 domain-containing protein [Roseobacter sp. CCS2]EBA11568.1 hypothetical protein RCCS2_16606 [Roseobacter sp. CCS2]